MLQEEFFLLIKKYSDDAAVASRLWSELESAYSGEDRYFHTLGHIEKMLAALKPLNAQMEDWDTVAFAVFYHDCIYDVVRYVAENDNEDRSAEEAERALKTIGYPQEKIERCKQHILATKHHKRSADNDTNFITDADLIVLGRPWEEYKKYMNNIRKEYAVFPDNIYFAGRNNFLKNVLRSGRLFKTDYFHQLFESAAQENIQRELEIVSFY